MKRSVLLALLVLALLLHGCGEEAPVEPAPSTPSAPEAPVESPEPAEPPPAREVRFDAEDGVTVVGELRPAADASAPLIVLVHQLSTNRAEWAPLLERLREGAPVATLAIDMRGHGESTERGDDAVSWQDFETEDWMRVPDDVRAAVDHVREHESLSPSRVILVGSSIGSSAVIVAAADEPTVHAVVALSPGRAYRGVDAMNPLTRLGDRPLLAVASRDETAARETAEQMGTIAPGGRTVLVEGDRHGVAMFTSDPTSLDAVVDFLRVQTSDDG